MMEEVDSRSWNYSGVKEKGSEADGYHTTT